MEQKNKIFISIVIPVYGSSEVLEELYRRTSETLEKITSEFEIIFVNDSSPDGAWEVIATLCQKDSRVRGLNLSRNFGQYPAITAGLKVSRGEWVVIMDCDLQDQPEEIEAMYKKALEGFYVVVGSRQKRHDSKFRLFFSKAFYSTLSYFSGTYQDGTVANFGIYHRKVIDAVLSMNDHMRYFSVMVRWIGFKTTTVPVEHASRKGGKSGYSFNKLFGLATDIILAYSEGPLRFIVKVGVTFSFISGIYLIVVVNKADASDVDLLLSTIWFIFGLLSTMIGVVALYLGKTFEESKKRPFYIVQEEV